MHGFGYNYLGYEVTVPEKVKLSVVFFLDFT